MATTDHLGRELEDDSNRPQTVEDYAREHGNLTGVYGEAEEQTTERSRAAQEEEQEQRRQSTAEQRTDSDRNG
jgi:hypothetical protein